MCGKGSRAKRKRWRDIAFGIIGNRSLVDIDKGDRSKELKGIYEHGKEKR